MRSIFSNIPASMMLTKGSESSYRMWDIFLGAEVESLLVTNGLEGVAESFQQQFSTFQQFEGKTERKSVIYTADCGAVH